MINAATAAEARQLLARAMPEAELLANVVEMAKSRGWMFCHFRPAQNRRGKWSTPIQGTPGFPDLVLIRGTRGLAIELKAERVTKVPDEQLRWLSGFQRVGFEAHVWRPRDLLNGAIEEALL